MDFKKLTTQFLQESEISNTAYRCAQGFLRIGAGRNLETQGLSEEELFYLTQNDLQKGVNVLATHIRGWMLLTPPLQIFWLKLLFYLDETPLFSQQKLVDLLCAQQFEAAAFELSCSPWGQEMPNLSKPLVESLLCMAQKPN